MKKSILFFVFITLVAGSSLTLQATILRNYGVGAKAAAMGGAFVGLCDDYSAIYWNPAGLCQNPNDGVFISSAPIMQTGDFRYEAIGVQTSNASIMNFSGAFGYIKPLSEKTMFGVSISETPLFSVKWDAQEFEGLFGSAGPEFKSSAGDLSISPAVAYLLSKNIQVGAALNFHYVRWSMAKPSFIGQYSEDLKGVGVGATVGILVHSFSNSVSLGVTFKTPVKVKLSGDADLGHSFDVMASQSGGEREITLPMWVGVGLALKTYKRLWATFDMHYTKWNNFDILKMAYDDPMWAQVLDGDMELNWKQGTVIRVGLEYKASDRLSIRAGYYMDRSPAPDNSTALLIPSGDLSWFTCGFGYFGDRLVLEAGIEVALKKDRELATVVTNFNRILTVEEGVVGDVKERKYFGNMRLASFIPTLSLSYRF